jgi:hypothetical protein
MYRLVFYYFSNETNKYVLPNIYTLSPLDQVKHKLLLKISLIKH